MANRGKKHQEALRLVDRTKAYAPREAIELAKKAAHAAFAETVELHLQMGADPRHAEQQVRGVALLPNGLGKRSRILVFAQGEAALAAKEAGADYVGGDELVKKIEDGWLEFDVSIASQDMMGKVGKLGRILGRRGLMPNPKSGTVAAPADLPRVIGEARKGRVEFRLDRTSIIHVPIGKVDFEEERLLENLGALVEAILKARPSGIKGQYIKRASLATTMGPGIRLDIQPMLALASS